MPLRTAFEVRAGTGGGPAGTSTDDDLTLIRIAARSARNSSAATSVLVLDTAGAVLASSLPEQLGRVLELPGDVLTTGRSWVG